jgi:broad specificity phosphatase PhoE
VSELLDIVVARHGESKANAEARMQGRFDSPLNERGQAQARALGSFLSRVGFVWDQALSSPLRRALETARIAASAAGGSAPEVDPDLAEVAAGRLEGLSAAEIEEQYPSYPARRLDELGDFAEYGGESYAQIQDRVASLLQRLLGAASPPRRVLLVGHGGFNFHLVKRLICVPVPRVCVLRMDNCCATLIRVHFRRGMQIGEVVWHLPIELMDPHIDSQPAPAPGSAAS